MCASRRVGSGKGGEWSAESMYNIKGLMTIVSQSPLWCGRSNDWSLPVRRSGTCWRWGNRGCQGSSPSPSPAIDQGILSIQSWPRLIRGLSSTCRDSGAAREVVVVAKCRRISRYQYHHMSNSTLRRNQNFQNVTAREEGGPSSCTVTAGGARSHWGQLVF